MIMCEDCGEAKELKKYCVDCGAPLCEDCGWGAMEGTPEENWLCEKCMKKAL